MAVTNNQDKKSKMSKQAPNKKNDKVKLRTKLKNILVIIPIFLYTIIAIVINNLINFINSLLSILSSFFGSITSTKGKYYICNILLFLIPLLAISMEVLYNKNEYFKLVIDYLEKPRAYIYMVPLYGIILGKHRKLGGRKREENDGKTSNSTSKVKSSQSKRG